MESHPFLRNDSIAAEIAAGGITDIIGTEEAPSGVLNRLHVVQVAVSDALKMSDGNISSERRRRCGRPSRPFASHFNVSHQRCDGGATCLLPKTLKIGKQTS